MPLCTDAHELAVLLSPCQSIKYSGTSEVPSALRNPAGGSQGPSVTSLNLFCKEPEPGRAGVSAQGVCFSSCHFYF